MLQNFGDRGVRALLSDSTNAHLSGSSISESEVVDRIDDIFKEAKARVITATFSSIIDRIILIIATLKKFGRKVVLLGRGMNKLYGYCPQARVRSSKTRNSHHYTADKLPDDQVTICCTGAQGERYAVLMRIATGESYDTTLKPSDTVVFSSSVIPGNERSVQGLFDIIMAQGPRICQYKESRIHAGGHAQEEDTKKMIELIRPEVYVPIYGFPFMLRKREECNGTLDTRMRISLLERTVRYSNSLPIRSSLTNMYAPHRLVTVDGNMIGYSKEDTLHDRFQLNRRCDGRKYCQEMRRIPLSIDNVGLPKMSEFPHLEKRLIQLRYDSPRRYLQVQGTLKLSKYIAKKIEDTVFDEIAKEPLVMVLAH